ncbi:MAG: acetate--CoA ligase [Candidatus Zixiibacteriota bacterium]|nr:MAG: acetate--CoA ligase [candidate division Zixibacteria bacterium]
MSAPEEKTTDAVVAALLEENRVIPPPDHFRAQARLRDESLYAEAARDPEAFWAQQAQRLTWFKPWDKVLEWNPPEAKWFTGGRLNASYNCLDRHIKSGLRNKAALIWEGEPGDTRTLTYWDLYRDVNKFANVLKSLGVKKGDRVALYMPMIPELVIAMLACARIGAIHTVVFGGFSPESLQDRINDAQAKLLVTADGGFRKGSILPLKHDADYALSKCPSIEKVIIVKRDEFPLRVREGRDHWYHRLMQDAAPWCEPEPMDAEDVLYILYTSGTTGKPKGIVHTTGGYLTGVAATTEWVFDLKADDVFWCTADIGWVTGHSYVVYGPLLNGATQVMYEGSPDWPDKDRFWRLVDKYGVSIFYTAPTAIRTFMKWGPEWTQGSDLSSLRLLGTVGEPINPEAWMWYYKYVGRERCPVVDTWWQTETGMIMIAPLPGLTPAKPGSATRPLPGVSAAVLDDQGGEIPVGGGYLALTRPWPAMLRGIWGDPERYRTQYWSKWREDLYFTGDGAKRDEEGYYWLLGRVDDVINISGHRIGTMEVESALVDHESVAEAACVGISDPVKGEAIAAFVTLKDGSLPQERMDEFLKRHVEAKIGAIARPGKIIFTGDLPKTRSGKIMRRLLRDIAEGRLLGDITTLADDSVITNLKKKYEEE